MNGGRRRPGVSIQASRSKPRFPLAILAAGTRSSAEIPQDAQLIDPMAPTVPGIAEAARTYPGSPCRSGGVEISWCRDLV